MQVHILPHRLLTCPLDLRSRQRQSRKDALRQHRPRLLHRWRPRAPLVKRLERWHDVPVHESRERARVRGVLQPLATLAPILSNVAAQIPGNHLGSKGVNQPKLKVAQAHLKRVALCEVGVLGRATSTEPRPVGTNELNLDIAPELGGQAHGQEVGDVSFSRSAARELEVYRDDIEAAISMSSEPVNVKNTLSARRSP